jgi:hypothetical protein
MSSSIEPPTGLLSLALGVGFCAGAIGCIAGMGAGGTIIRSAIAPGWPRTGLLIAVGVIGIGAYSHTYRHDIHAKRYGLPNVRVLTVTPGRQRIANIIASYRQHVAALVSPKFFLFADRGGLSRAEDFLDYPWLDAAGEQHRLLD